MNDKRNPHNAADPIWLTSRDIDGDLTSSEKQRLRDTLAASDSLQSDAERFRRVDQLVKRLAADRVELDWNAYTATVMARVTSDVTEEDIARVDGLLKEWRKDTVSLNEDQFTAAVMTAIRKPARTGRVGKLLFRFGVPLAAAAVIGLVVTGTFRSKPASQPVAEVVWSHGVEHRRKPGRSLSLAMVTFDRTPARLAERPASVPGISISCVGVSSEVFSSVNGPPL